MKQHRVYNYVGAPLLILGLTLPELGSAFMGFAGFIIFKSLIYKFVSLIGACGFVVVRRRIAKMYRGTALASFMYWYAGFESAPKKSWVSSYKRNWWCQ